MTLTARPCSQMKVRVSQRRQRLAQLIGVLLLPLAAPHREPARLIVIGSLFLPLPLLVEPGRLVTHSLPPDNVRSTPRTTPS